MRPSYVPRPKPTMVDWIVLLLVILGIFDPGLRRSAGRTTSPRAWVTLSTTTRALQLMWA